MTSIQSQPGHGRYLVSSMDSGKLSQFIAEAQQDTELQLLETIGPGDSPHTAVFDMAHDKAASLQQRFKTSGELSIEPDQPLSLFGNS